MASCQVHRRRLGRIVSAAGLRCAVWAVAASVALVDQGPAGERPLAALVPADAGMCLEARGLAAAVRQFRSSAHFDRLREFPPWRRWQAKQGQELTAVADQVAAALHVPASDLWEKIAGQQVLVAIWPKDEAGEPKPERPAAATDDHTAHDSDRTPAVLLLRGADAEVVRTATDGFREAQKSLENVSWQTLQHRGIDYHLGTRPDKRPPMRLAVLGSMVVLSEDEAIFHRVLDLTHEVSAPPTGPPASLAQLPAYAAAAKSMPPGAALTLFLNPRTWEKSMQADVAAASPTEQGQKKLLLETWQAIEACWATVELTPRVRLQAVVKYDARRLPAPVGEFVACFGGGSGFLGKVPEGALLAAAARVDADRFITWARKYGEKQPKPSDEAEVVVSLLRLLGPDLGIYLQPAAAGDAAHWLQWAGAVGVRPQMPPERESLQLVQAMVQPLLATVAKSMSESASSRLAGLFLGDGLRSLSDSLRLSRSAISTVTLADGRLWVAGSERALSDAQAVGGDKSLATSRRWTNHLDGPMREPSHLLYVHCDGWRQLLDRHAKALVATTVRERGVDEKTAQNGLDQLRSLLRLADTVVAAIKIDDGQIAVSLSAAVEPPPASPSSSPTEPAERP